MGCIPTFPCEIRAADTNLSPQWGFTPWRRIAAARIILKHKGKKMRFNKQINHPQNVSTGIHFTPPMNQLPEAAMEIARKAADGARETAQRAAAIAKDVTNDVEDLTEDVVDTTRNAARRARGTAKDIYHSAALKAGDTLAASKQYVRRNPVPVVIGAIAIGAAIGYLIMNARRKPTFSKHLVEEPLVAVRGTLRSALAPVSQRVHEGYESARDGMGKTMNRVQRLKPGRAVDLFSKRIGRVGSNLKLW